MDSGTKTPAAPELGHERTDVSAAAAVLFGLGIAVITGVGLLLMIWLFSYLEDRSEERNRVVAPLPAREAQRPAVSREQLELLREYERRMLEEYEWVDRSTGVVRIPIDAAMELIVKRSSESQGDAEGGSE